MAASALVACARACRQDGEQVTASRRTGSNLLRQFMQTGFFMSQIIVNRDISAPGGFAISPRRARCCCVISSISMQPMATAASIAPCS
jgi:hypothetical protein